MAKILSNQGTKEMNLLNRHGNAKSIDAIKAELEAIFGCGLKLGWATDGFAYYWCDSPSNVMACGTLSGTYHVIVKRNSSTGDVITITEEEFLNDMKL